MQLTLIPYHLQFKYPFKIAHGMRTGTNVVYVKLQHNGLTAWGEATLPPYLPETQESVIAFLKGFEATVGSTELNDWIMLLSKDSGPDMAAKAALDMALWSLKAQQQQKSIAEIINVPQQFPQGTYTVGISTLAEMEQKITEALQYGFTLFKLKLNGIDDKQMVDTYTRLCHLPFAVDVNQGWKTANEAIDKINWLKSTGCLLVEQPLPKNNFEEMQLVKQHSVLPLYADESCQTIADIEKVAQVFDGVNIKLMKCGGISPALQMVDKARQLGLHILIGCMSESSVGCTAAAQITPLADYADLDGPYLIANDPFTGMKIKNGRISINALNTIRQL